MGINGTESVMDDSSVSSDVILDPDIEQEIRCRYRTGAPLNITAIKRQAPHVIERLFQKENFIGWRSALLACDIQPGDTCVELEETVVCLICGFEGKALMTHLGKFHGLEPGAYQTEFPGAPMISEEMTARRSYLQGRATGRQLPHWEPLWSPEYALDRLHHYHLRGELVYFRHILALDAKLVSAILRLFSCYDEALAAIGLDPADIRQLEHRSWTPENILQTLQQRAREGASFGIVAMRREFGGLIHAAEAAFGSYEDALRRAGIDPTACVDRRPRITEGVFDTLEAEACRLAASERDPEKIRAFHARFGRYIQRRYGNYSNLAAQLGIPQDRLILHKPRRFYSRGKGQ